LAPIAVPAASTDHLTTEFAGTRGAVFWMSVRMGLLTVLTLGVYRFWMKTRLRRWYWSAVRPGGIPLEYVGTPYEKLLGFLIAVVILAFYIGVVNLILMFASFSLFQGNFAAYLLSFLGLVPLWFYAQYRARRYILARTRWRGLRFGLEPGAWGYVARAVLYWGLTIVSAGLLLPLMTYRLEAYKTNRTFFGDTRMHQGGRWTMLYRSMRWMFVAAGFGVTGAAVFVSGNEPGGIGIWVLAGMVGLFGLVYYRVDSLRHLTATKTLGGVTLDLTASPMRVLVIHVIGYMLAGIVIALLLMIFGLLIAATLPTDTIVRLGLEQVPDLAGLEHWMLIGSSIAVYFTIFLLWAALSHAFITMPVIRHYAGGLAMRATDHLRGINQRPRDEFTEAEGFAEALDVGASL
jgi:uncharacterized membrane protein YjgN (DUF898 family)